jgi:GxxExxY protein
MVWVPSLPEAIPQRVEDIGTRVIGCAIDVHRVLGPGYKEPVYHRAFSIELEQAGLKYEREKRICVFYKGREVGIHRIDLIVEGCVIVELKAIAALLPVHRLQVLSYLKATGLRLGYVMNFNSEVVHREIKRVVL